MGILIQVVATVILCLSSMNIGINMGWPSSTLLLFKSENTTLDRPMTDMDVNLFTSLPVIGAFVAQPLMLVCVLNKIGLKYTTIAASMLFAVSWTIIALSNRVEAILFAMVTMGAANTVLVPVSMYISEIAQDSIRGTLTSGPNLTLNLGVLVSYILGGILEYHVMVYTCLSMAVIAVIMILILKDSPVQLMVKGREEEAMRSLAFYRQTNSASREMLAEINNIRRSLNVEVKGEHESLVPLEKKVVPVNGTNKMTFWQIIKNTASVRRQFYLALVLQTSVFYQGLPCIQIFAEPIFSETMGEGISANLYTVVLGVVILVATVVAAYLTDIVGRRPLQIYSSIVGGVCSLFLGTQVTTDWFPKWTIPLVIYLFATFYCMGAGNIPFVVTAEIFLPEHDSVFTCDGAIDGLYKFGGSIPISMILFLLNRIFATKIVYQFTNAPHAVTGAPACSAPVRDPGASKSSTSTVTQLQQQRDLDLNTRCRARIADQYGRVATPRITN